MCSSPRLIAACHVLHRLLMPRHSPCALFSLTFVGANCAHSVSASRRKLRIASLLLLSESNPLRWASIRWSASRSSLSLPCDRFYSEKSGSQELCRPQFSYIVVCVTHFKKSTIKLCYLSVACSQFLASLFSFQGAVPAFFKARSKCSPSWTNTSIQSRKRSGGPKWTRTTDLTIISRAL